jgi:hypothetical protein
VPLSVVQSSATESSGILSKSASSDSSMMGCGCAGVAGVREKFVGIWKLRADTLEGCLRCEARHIGDMGSMLVVGEAGNESVVVMSNMELR